jgi:formate/nitrite transporter FocA (FNT family)
LAEPVVEMLVASMYAIGFIFVVLGRSELFTEQTSLAVLPVLNGKASVATLLRLWGIVYVGNLIGATGFAYLASVIGPALGVLTTESLGTLADKMVQHPGWVILLSAILAGWMMGLLSWLVAAGRDTISQILVVAIITAAIGFAGLHHVVVGSVEVLAGVFVGEATLAEFGHFLLWATLGNAIGGTVFVALIKSGHGLRGSRFGAR